MYANAWFIGAREPEEFARKARQTVALGVKALKWDPFGAAHLTISNEPATEDHCDHRGRTGGGRPPC